MRPCGWIHVLKLRAHIAKMATAVNMDFSYLSKLGSVRTTICTALLIVSFSNTKRQNA